MISILKGIGWAVLTFGGIMVFQAFHFSDYVTLVAFVLLVWLGLGYNLEMAKDRIDALEWRLEDAERQLRDQNLID